MTHSSLSNVNSDNFSVCTRPYEYHKTNLELQVGGARRRGEGVAPEASAHSLDEAGNAQAGDVGDIAHHASDLLTTEWSKCEWGVHAEFMAMPELCRAHVVTSLLTHRESIVKVPVEAPPITCTEGGVS